MTTPKPLTRAEAIRLTQGSARHLPGSDIMERTLDGGKTWTRDERPPRLGDTERHRFHATAILMGMDPDEIEIALDYLREDFRPWRHFLPKKALQALQQTPRNLLECIKMHPQSLAAYRKQK